MLSLIEEFQWREFPTPTFKFNLLEAKDRHRFRVRTFIIIECYLIGNLYEKLSEKVISIDSNSFQSSSIKINSIYYWYCQQHCYQLSPCSSLDRTWIIVLFVEFIYISFAAVSKLWAEWAIGRDREGRVKIKMFTERGQRIERSAAGRKSEVLKCFPYRWDVL